MAIDFAPATIADEVIQNIRTILATPRGSVPMARALGVTGIGLDDPIARAKTSLTAEYVEAIAKFEPRAQVKAIAFTSDALTGHLGARVTFVVEGQVRTI